MNTSSISITRLPDGIFDRPVPTLGLPDLAFIGKAGAGKSTCADYLAENYGYRKVSFAALLKDVAAALWGTRDDRNKLQKLGVAVRDIDTDTWVNAAVREIEANQNVGLATVIDDCRFPNEVAALEGLGFKFARVECPRLVRIDRLKGNGKWQSEDQLDHPSETALDGLLELSDYAIENWTGDKDALYAQVVSVLNAETKKS